MLGSQVEKTKRPCGEAATTDDHVVPSAWYPPSRGGSDAHRIPVNAADRSNGGWPCGPGESCARWCAASANSIDCGRKCRMVRYGPITIDHHRYEIPPAFLAEMIVGHVEEDIFDYKYAVIDDPELHSAWLLRFFQRVPFF